MASGGVSSKSGAMRIYPFSAPSVRSTLRCGTRLHLSTSHIAKLIASPQHWKVAIPGSKCSELMRPNTPTLMDTRFRGYDGGCVRCALSRSLNSYNLATPLVPTADADVKWREPNNKGESFIEGRVLYCRIQPHT